MSESVRRQVPENALDFNAMLLEPDWGKPTVSEDLKLKLTKEVFLRDDKGELLKDEQGNFLATKEGLWGLIGFYTRDMRLSNINHDELVYCAHFLDLCADLLQEKGQLKPFMMSLSRAVTVLELGQSKNGFLRRQNNTITQEIKEKPLEPEKKSLFTGNAKR